jgi:hypothetical protein
VDNRGGYGKRSVWFWIGLYAGIGVLVYAIVYFAFLNGGGGGAY